MGGISLFKPLLSGGQMVYLEFSNRIEDKQISHINIAELTLK